VVDLPADLAAAGAMAAAAGARARPQGRKRLWPLGLPARSAAAATVLLRRDGQGIRCKRLRRALSHTRARVGLAARRFTICDERRPASDAAPTTEPQCDAVAVQPFGV
jgi:hypothetical protein